MYATLPYLPCKNFTSPPPPEVSFDAISVASVRLVYTVVTNFLNKDRTARLRSKFAPERDVDSGTDGHFALFVAVTRARRVVAYDLGVVVVLHSFRGCR